MGLGYQVPKEAKEGHYVDKKCPFTGNVSIRGAVVKGMCISTKMKRTIIIRRNYLHYIKRLDMSFKCFLMLFEFAQGDFEGA